MRDNNIDFLRGAGLLLIILAHIGPPNWIQQLRCFDVPLMVFISGLSSSGKVLTVPYSNFVIRRTKRLVYPTWLFISFYIFLLYIAQSLEIIPHYITWNRVIESFLLLKGVGYVWIIRVFLLMMLITPLLNKLCLKVRRTWVFILFLFSLYVLQEVLCFVIPKISFNSVLSFIINEYILYLIGYSLLFVLGIKLRTYQNKRYTTAIIVFILLLLLIVNAIVYIRIYGTPIYINEFKYPPHAFFLIYGASISVILWLIKPLYKCVSNNVFFLFLGRNSIWIYLWHIPFVLIANEYVDSWILRYVFVLVACITIYRIQYSLVNKSKLSRFSQYLIG